MRVTEYGRGLGDCRLMAAGEDDHAHLRFNSTDSGCLVGLGQCWA